MTTPRRAAIRVTALLCMVLGLVGLLAAPSVRAQDGAVHVLSIDGIINPISSRYVIHGIEEAVEEGATAVILEIDTPGGLLEATQDMTSAMLGARVPVITYVTPAGAQAASAGTFITMAGHVAAMAPSTRMGAATPVSTEGDIPDDLRTKIVNDTVEYARIIANARGRNADWAEEAVRDAAVINAETAVEIEAVDLVAATRAELLELVQGRTVLVAGLEVTLDTAGVPVEERDMSPFEDLLVALTDPNIALLLLSLGSLGIYFELANPGAFFPGIAGAIAIILGLFSLGTLPINYAGLALVLLGLALLGSEIWVTSGGVLGVGGAIAFLLGALILIDDTRAPFLEISRPLIYGITLALVLFSVVALRAVMRSRKRPVSIGGKDMVGRQALVRSPTSVFVEGELWRARPAVEDSTLEAGGRVRIVGRDGFELIVEPLTGSTEATEEET